MAKEGENLKNYSKHLWTFIVVNSIILLCIVYNNSLSFNFINDTYKNIFGKGIIAACSATIPFILNGLLTSDLKAILVYWRINNFYPGHRIFTEIMNQDCRIDKSVLIKQYGVLPTLPQEQNKLWYKIFKSYEYDTMIFQSHRDSLLSRDLTGLSFIFLVLYPIAAILLSYSYNIGRNILFFYIGFLALQYIVLALVSKHYGIRFACNVLAKASSSTITQ